ncbi:unnamed protein product, partial [Ixodes hexagonus]
ALPVVQASRAQILKKAADYIQTMRRKNTAHLQDIEDLKRQNKLLEDQSGFSRTTFTLKRVCSADRVSMSLLAVRSLEKTKVASSGYSSGSMLDSVNLKGDSISAFDGGSGSESSEDTDNSSRGSRKKLKTSPGSTPLHS